jgi:hypothetical protein
MENITIYPKQFANICSPLQKMELLLYHEAIKSKDYVDFFSKCNNYKILDNSQYELRKEINYSELIKLGKFMNIQEIILPDKLNDMNWTLDAIKDNLKIFGEIYIKLKWKVAAVLQGNDNYEIRKCLLSYIYNPYIDVIMIPRKLIHYPSHTYSSSRLKAWLNIIYPMLNQKHLFGIKQIHFLGANSLGDLFPPLQSFIRSIDSKLLIKIITNGWKWKNWKDLNNCDIDYFTKQYDFIQHHFIKNFYGEV